MCSFFVYLEAGAAEGKALGVSKGEAFYPAICPHGVGETGV
jgi:hypothetical protein